MRHEGFEKGLSGLIDGYRVTTVTASLLLVIIITKMMIIDCPSARMNGMPANDNAIDRHVELLTCLV